MLNHNYVSIRRVLENIIRDTGFTEEINFADAVEWAYIAMELIGAPQIYTKKVTDGNLDLNHPMPLVVENYRVELPTDMHQIIQMRIFETKMSMIETTSTFPSSMNYPDEGKGLDVTYRIDNGWAFFNFKEGNVEMAYYAFPTDEEGYPSIPDDVRYLKAVEAYIVERIARKLWIKDKLSREKYNELERDWLFYVRSAKSRAQYPNIDGMEAFKNQITRLISHSDRHKHQFLQQGTEEEIKIGRNRFGRA